MTEKFIIQNLQATRGLLVQNLTDGSVSTLRDHDGLGLPPVNNITEAGPYEHGETFIDLRLRPRVIILTFGVQGSDPDDLEEKLGVLTRIFKPGTSVIQLDFELPSGVTKRIDTRYNSGLQYGSKDLTRHYQRVAARVTSYDVVFYDPELTSLVFGVGGAVAGFTVPMPVPFNVGTTTLNLTKTIEYQGTWREYPLVQINGPVTNPVVNNLSTGEKLDFTGVTLTAGQSIEVDLRPKYKTVVDENGVNRISWLTDDSDLSTFHLGEDDDVPSGANDIQVVGTGINTQTEIYLQYHTRYISLY